jgi:hypothetical protein
VNAPNLHSGSPPPDTAAAAEDLETHFGFRVDDSGLIGKII